MVFQTELGPKGHGVRIERVNVVFKVVPSLVGSGYNSDPDYARKDVAI